jgi:hypothetical protein
MKYKDIKDFYQRCEEHPDHQSGMVSHSMIQLRLGEEIDELRDYIEQRTWVGLTNEKVEKMWDFYKPSAFDFYVAIDSELKAKNAE